MKICNLDDITINTAVNALINGEQVAIFRASNDKVYAVNNKDPFSLANVLSRGIIGEEKGICYITSPIYKQRFNLQTGECLDDPEVKISTYSVTVVNNSIHLESA